MKKKIIAVGTSVLVMVTLAGCGQQKTNQNKPSAAPTENTPTNQPQSNQQVPVDETADWETYTNEKYGFSLKYPNVINNSETEIPKSVQDSALQGDGYIGPEIFNLGLSKEDPENTENGIIVTVIKRANNDPVVSPGSEEETSIIDGQKAYKYSGSYFVEKNGYVYQLSAFGDAYYSNVLERMVTTFKFTK